MSEKRSLYRTLTDAVSSYRMTDGVKGVLVGYSGGADSSALLYAMQKYCNEHSLYLHALHVHHGIRGEEADRDAEHCRLTCERLGIDFTLERADIPALAKERGKGIEETARDFRYEAFVRCISAHPRLDCAATAHNADDNAETVLFNLARGSGSAGLCGIPPVRYHNGVRIIRPLIFASKKEITDYCEENGIQYIFDSTNNDTAYTRNYIRHEILPRMEHLNPSFLSSVARMTRHLNKEREFSELCADEFLDKYGDSDGIPVSEISSLHTALASRVIVKMFSRVSNATLEGVHVDAVLSLVQTAREGACLSLVGGMNAFIKNGRLFFGIAEKREKPDYCTELTTGVNLFEDGRFAIFMIPDGKISTDLQKDNETLKNIYKLSIHTHLNFDTINRVLIARSRHDGDSYVFGGMTRKLKKLYNDRALPLEIREMLPVICDSEGIVWVPGFQPADRVRSDGKGTELIYYYNE